MTDFIGKLWEVVWISWLVFISVVGAIGTLSVICDKIHRRRRRAHRDRLQHIVDQAREIIREGQ